MECWGQLDDEHFFIFAPGKPAGIAAVNDNPGKIVSGAGSLDLIRDTLRTFGAVTVHHLVNVCIFQRCTEIKKYIKTVWGMGYKFEVGE